MKMFINSENPIIIGFSGPAGSGKTYTANRLIPSVNVDWIGSENTPESVWHHYFFSSPLYEMYNIKTMTKGKDAKDRILHGLHEVLRPMFLYQCEYDELIELVYNIYSIPVREGEKPRAFLQQAGDLCKEINQNCFGSNIYTKIMKNHKTLKREFEDADKETPWNINIVSDIRYPNEVEILRENPGLTAIFKFNVSPQKANERLLERDGKVLNSSEQRHSSENNYDLIKADFVIDTNDLSSEDQIILVYSKIKEMLGLKEDHFKTVREMFHG